MVTKELFEKGVRDLWVSWDCNTSGLDEWGAYIDDPAAGERRAIAWVQETLCLSGNDASALVEWVSVAREDDEELFDTITEMVKTFHGKQSM